MAQITDIKNGVSTLSFEEVIITDQFKVAVYFERLVSQNPDTFEPIDFSGMEMKADIKLKASKEETPDATFECNTRVEPGWVDLYLDGEVTASLLEKTYEASLKVWPTGHPEQGDTLIKLLLPMKYKATR